MPKHYDEKGNQSGWTDDNGRHYDDKGNFSGWTDDNGRHYDDKGNFSGWTDEKGRHRDDKGNFSGWTDEKGRHRDDKGNFSGWTESSSTTTSSSTSSTSSSSTSRGGSSSSSNGGGLEILFAIFAIATAVISMAIVVSPIIAPILLTKIETARKKGDFAYVKEWTSWALAASITAVLVVLVAAGAISFVITTSILRLTVNSTSPVLTNLVYIVAIIAGIISFALLSTTGISPTALIYLKNKESYLLSSGEVAKAKNLQQYRSRIKTTAISTVILVIAIFVIIPLVSVVTNWASTKLQTLAFSPPTTVQNSPLITEPTKVVFTHTPTSIITNNESNSQPTVTVVTATFPVVVNPPQQQTQPPSSDAFLNYVGEWRGTGFQYNTGGNWSITMIIDDGQEGTVVGRIDYPSLQCGGDLTLLNVNNQGILFRENITYGSNCIDNGFIRVALLDVNTLDWIWSTTEDGEDAKSTLSRSR